MGDGCGRVGEWANGGKGDAAKGEWVSRREALK